jgi:hypothetical protein
VRPVGRAQIPASVTMLSAPFPEPALPARSLIPAITGADVPVEIAVTSGDKPLRSTCRFAIFVCPNDAPCLACLSTAEHRVDVRQRQGVDAGQHAGPLRHRQQVIARRRRQLPGVAVGGLPEQESHVEAAYTAPNSLFMPPARITSRSSTLSAGRGFAEPRR